ncbi:MAG: export ABC transporter ATP-binding protein [Actinobacteria bacterium HGW-Actinobacteria-7]|nr:MAG: export ABC transporter ATP-binding protein [Actinobacteria bacterium HGW-Actinobacteria-7]
MSVIVEIRDLVKCFGELTAVDHVTFEIERGEIFGLLGPNGAGKTTTISMISCLLAPDEGDVIVAGHSVRTHSIEVRRALGIVPQEIALYPTLTAAENLKFWGRMYGLSGRELDEAVDYGLEMAGLADKARVRVETFSGGMKRRINIAAGVLHRPQVLLMDEPTVGIDPQSRNHILETVRELNRDGMTVVYTSHYMEEVETLCDRIAIVDHGRVIADGTLDELRALVGDEDHIRISLGDASPEGSAEAAEGDADTGVAEETETPPEMLAILEGIRQVPGVTRADAVGSALEVLAGDAAAVLGGVVESIAAAGAHLRAIEVVEPDLESVFLHLTGRGLRD